MVARLRFFTLLTAWLAGFGGGLGLAAMAQAQIHSSTASFRDVHRNFVMPQTRAFCGTRPGPVRITQVDATVDIREQVASTTLDIRLHNPGSQRLESVLLLPVPDGAAVRAFDFNGSGAEPSARLLPRDEARRIYDEIVARIKDPALLEFVGYRLVRSSVFPVEPGGTQRVRLTYESVLPADGDRIDYVLPRSESLDYAVPWNIQVRVRGTQPVSTLYSPSHPVETRRVSPRELSVQLTDAGRMTPGSFRLSYLREAGGVSASLIAYPDPRVGGGYFLLLAGLPADTATTLRESQMRRDVTLVIDRSGSMNGEKIEQVREAVLQIVGGLEWGETFNIIPYNESVDAFAPGPVPKTRDTLKAASDYVAGILPRGGTNIHDALVEALRQKPAEGSLPIVLFLTDGLPTVGNTSEVAIRKLALDANPHDKRIFTFGVGVDVNTPLLEKIAFETRATSTFVLPQENVEVKVGRVFDRLAGPVLASPQLAVTTAAGQPALGRVRDMIPGKLPDLFQGDQLVLLGQYIGEGPLQFEVSGNYLGKKRTFRFGFDFDKATTRNAFVPRLWASRKIGLMIDAIRELGADTTTPFAPQSLPRPNDPRVRELVDAIVSLSTEYGILTEYTAFLATEGTDLGRSSENWRRTNDNLLNRAMKVRSGLGSVNQDLNNMKIKVQSCVNPRNGYLDANMNAIEIATVQQISDRAFYRRGSQWIDGRIIQAGVTQKPDRVVAYGTDAYRALLEKLIALGRQGCLSLAGEILIDIDGTTILIKGPGC